jgi:hypothetical protein
MASLNLTKELHKEASAETMTIKEPKSEIVVKKKSKSKKDSFSPSYEEALLAIRAADASIKQAASVRAKAPVTLKESIEDYHCYKTMGFVLACTAVETGLSMTGMVNVWLPAVGTFLGGFLATAVTSTMPSVMAIMSPLKAKKLRVQLESDKALYDLKEMEFSEKEARILKKARKYVDVVEKELNKQDETIGYSNSSGREGFSVKKISHDNDWDMKLHQLKHRDFLALEQNERKEITI